MSWFLLFGSVFVAFICGEVLGYYFGQQDREESGE